MKQKEVQKMFFPITSVCMDDVIHAFNGSDQLPDVIKRMKELEESDMKYLASKMANDYLEQLYWDSLKILFEELFLEEVRT